MKEPKGVGRKGQCEGPNGEHGGGRTWWVCTQGCIARVLSGPHFIYFLIFSVNRLKTLRTVLGSNGVRWAWVWLPCCIVLGLRAVRWLWWARVGCWVDERVKEISYIVLCGLVVVVIRDSKRGPFDVRRAMPEDLFR